jgi:uncharacterized damage-inducible protein DinB
MTLAHFRTLFKYNAWANGRVLERVAELSQDEYSAPAGLDHGNGSIRATLVHALGTEEAWLERCQGRDLTEVLTEDRIPSHESLRIRWGEAASKWSSLLSRLKEADLDALVTNTSPRSGRTFTNPLWARLMHALNHSTQHRSEVALALTQLGHSPGDLDFLIYHAAATTRST